MSLPLLSLLSLPVFAATIDVPSPDALSQVLATARDGDTIQLEGYAYGSIRFPDHLHRLTLSGTVGTQVTDIKVGPGQDLVMSNMTVTGGPRGLMVSGGIASVRDVVFTGFHGDGDVFAVRASGEALVRLQDVTVEDTRSPFGAVQVSGATMELDGVTIAGNTGPALWVSGGSVSGESVFFSDNQAFHGAAILLADGDIRLSDAQFFDNRASSKGGAIYVSGGTFSATDSDWSGGIAELGGLMYVADGTVSITRAHLANGWASFGGGGLTVEAGSVTLRNTLWRDLSAPRGGAILVSGGATTVQHTVFTDNEAELGAAAAVEAGQLSIDSTILTSQHGAEAIANVASEPVRLERSLVYGNPSGDWEGNLFIAELVEEQAPGFLAAEQGEFVLSTGSPAIDTGSGVDRDGTTGDMGMYGGPDAWALSDADGDGYVYGRDCNDRDADVHESAVDRWYDGVDSNCDGASDFDQDQDGHDLAPAGGLGGDCNDTDPRIHPDAAESVDGIDSDCDSFDLSDADGDGWPSNMDCDDADSTAHPGAEETWYDGIDSDCSGGSDFDQDGDGHLIASVGGTDCDDTDPFTSPSAPEVLDDGIDQDCDGLDETTGASSERPDVAEVTGEDITPTPEAAPTHPDFEHYNSATVTVGCASVQPRLGGLLVLLALFGIIGRCRA